MKFGFVAKHRGIWPVRWLCEALDVLRSGFHAWLSRSPSARARGDEVLGAQDQTAMLFDGKIVWEGAASALLASGDPLVDQFTHGRREGPIHLKTI